MLDKYTINLIQFISRAI